MSRSAPPHWPCVLAMGGRYMVKKKLSLEGVTSMLDVGGGSGAFSCVLPPTPALPWPSPPPALLTTPRAGVAVATWLRRAQDVAEQR